MVLGALRRRLFYLTLSRVGDADNRRFVCATAKLYDAQFNEFGQRAANFDQQERSGIRATFRASWSMQTNVQ